MGETQNESDGVKPLAQVIHIDEERIRGHLDRIVRGSVEETLNALLDAEADRLCGAARYERCGERQDYRSGHYERQLQTKAGPVTLKMPKLRRQTLETAIIALSPPGELGGRGADGDVSGRGVRAARGGYYRSVVGHAREPQHGQRAEPEDLQDHPGLAQPAHPG